MDRLDSTTRLNEANTYRRLFLDPITGAAAAAEAINQTLYDLPTFESVYDAALETTGASLYALDHGRLVS